jgi:hypothetical protein
MSKLIGTNPDQVPSNADLGTSAYLNKSDVLLSRDAILKTIKGRINNGAALDVFVYDTTKDSDGGAWRQRTQHTSWYNEKLNTEFRGSRREFPSIAVIVSSIGSPDEVTIYDGDDPDLPMWMKFICDGSWTGESSNLNALGRSISAADGPGRLAFLNGKMCVTAAHNYAEGMIIIDFISETVYNASTSSYQYQWIGNGLVNRNIRSRILLDDNIGAPTINNVDVNDVSMSLSARYSYVDPKTGIEAPMIAMGTDSGICLVMPNGTVRTYTSSDIYKKCFNLELDGDRLTWIWDAYDNLQRMVHVFNVVPDNDVTDAGSAYPSADAGYFDITSTDMTPVRNEPYSITSYTKDMFGLTNNPNHSANAYSHGAVKLDHNALTPTKSMFARISNDFNTGWCPAVTQSVISDSEPGMILGYEHNPNTLTANVTDWYTIDGNNTIVWNSGTGYADVTRGGGSYVAAVELDYPIRAGNWYTVSVDVGNNGGSGNSIIRLGGAAGYNEDLSITTGTGILQTTFKATSNRTHLWIYAYPSQTTSVRNLTVKPGVPNRCNKDSGYSVQGYIEKTQVASNSDLVSYGNFRGPHGDSYLRDYAGVAPGTGQYFMSAWIWVDESTDGNYDHVLSLNSQDSPNGVSLKLWKNTDHRAYFYGNNRTLVITDQGPKPYNWTHICGGRKSDGNWYIYMNGVMYKSDTVNNFEITAPWVTIGYNLSTSESSGSSRYALVKYGSQFPTDEQILKMYAEEKMLFQDNAKCVLIGSDNIVNDVAYDPDTNLHHVGTDSGRSSFSDLCRVAETEEAVEVGISAAKGLIVED